VFGNLLLLGKGLSRGIRMTRNSGRKAKEETRGELNLKYVRCKKGCGKEGFPRKITWREESSDKTRGEAERGAALRAA